MFSVQCAMIICHLLPVGFFGLYNYDFDIIAYMSKMFKIFVV